MKIVRTWYISKKDLKTIKDIQPKIENKEL